MWVGSGIEGVNFAKLNGHDIAAECGEGAALCNWPPGKAVAPSGITKGGACAPLLVNCPPGGPHMEIVVLKKHIVNCYRCPLKKLCAPLVPPHLGMPSYATGIEPIQQISPGALHECSIRCDATKAPSEHKHRKQFPDVIGTDSQTPRLIRN